MHSLIFIASWLAIGYISIVKKNMTINKVYAFDGTDATIFVVALAGAFFSGLYGVLD